MMGAAALHYLVELGCPRPVLLERETLASGSTGHCAGGVRTLFSDELNVRIGLESIRAAQRFEEEVGQELDLGSTATCSCSTTLRISSASRRRRAPGAAGVDTRVLTPEEAAEIVPQLARGRPCGRRLQRARRHGDAGPRRPRLRAACRRTRRARRAVVRGRADRRRERARDRGRDRARPRSTPTASCSTAGVWSRELAASAGFDLPVQPERRFMYVTEDAPEFPGGCR